MANTINDYVFELQWDGNKVTKGIDAIEARLSKLHKGVDSKLSSTRERATSGKVTKSKYNAEKVLKDKQRNLAAIAKQEADVEWQQLKAQADQADHYQKRQAAAAKAQVKNEREKNAALKKLANQRIQEASFETARLRAITGISSTQGKLDRFSQSTVGMTGTRGAAVRENVGAASSQLKGFNEKWDKAGAIKSKDDLARMQQDLIRVNGLTKQLAGNAKEAQKQFSVMSNVTKRVGATWLAMGASTLGAYAVVAAGQAAYDSAKQYQKMDVAMTAAFGSQAASNEEMAYAEGVAKKYALDIFAVGEGWSKMAYSAKQANMPMADARQMFEDLSVSSRAFGLSADDTKGAMRAVVQMLGKGKVNAEDLRQQLAERIPAAIPMLAKSMGITIGELEDQMKAGAIPAEKLVGMFRLMATDVEASGALGKSMETLEAGGTLMINSLKKAGSTLFSSGLDSAFGKMFGTIGKFIDENESFIKGLGGTLALVVNKLTQGLEFAYRLLKPVFYGLGQIYELFELISNTPIEDAFDLGVVFGVLRNISGLMYSIYGMTENWLWSLENFSMPESIEGLAFVIDDIIKGLLWIAGQDTSNGEGGTNAGWAKSPAQAVVATSDALRSGASSASSAISNTFQILVNGNGDESIKTAVVEALQQTFSFGISPVTQ